MKKILFLAAVGLLFAAGNADAKAVKLGKSDDGGARIAAAKEKRVKSVKCEKGQFKNENGECVGCTVANCAECKSAGVCKRCNAGYSLLSGGTCGCASNAVCGDKEICENKVCVGVSCPDGYYASEHKCKACSSNCLTCSDQNTCTSCEPGKYLSGGSCNGCSAKFSHCLECDSTKCTKCDGETDKINGICVEPGCKTAADCTGNQVCKKSVCEECDEGYVKQGNSCVPDDPDVLPECTIDAECDENEKCENEGCVLKLCSEIDGSYVTGSCGDGKTTEDTGVTGFDGKCVICIAAGRQTGCSSNNDCGACQTCSSEGKCVAVSCGADQECNNAHGCKDKSKTCTIGSYSDCPTGTVCNSQKGEIACHTCNQGSNVSTTFKCNCPSDTLSDGKGGCAKKEEPKTCTIGSYADCPTGTVCNSQKGETACHTCNQGSNVSTTFKCNCPSDTLSDGKGGCAKKEEPKTCTIGSYSDCPTGTVCDSQKGETACHTCNQGSNVSTTFKCNCPSDTLSDGKGGCTKKSTGNSGSNTGSNTGSKSSGSNTGSKSSGSNTGSNTGSKTGGTSCNCHCSGCCPRVLVGSRFWEQCTTVWPSCCD